MSKKKLSRNGPWIEDDWVSEELKLAREIEEPKLIIKIKFGKGKDCVVVGDIIGVNIGGMIMARYKVLNYNSKTGEAEVQTIIRNQKRGSTVHIIGNMNCEGAIIRG